MSLRYLLVGIFGVLGVYARFQVSLVLGRFLPTPFPYATFAINILGALLIGVVYVLGFERQLLGPELRTAIMVGFLGGFTTFSSYCLEASRLLEEANYAAFFSYLTLSPVLGLAATFAGLALTRICTGPTP